MHVHDIEIKDTTAIKGKLADLDIEPELFPTISGSYQSLETWKKLQLTDPFDYHMHYEETD